MAPERGSPPCGGLSARRGSQRPLFVMLVTLVLWMFCTTVVERET
jgi:hypothetical protein